MKNMKNILIFTLSFYLSACDPDFKKTASGTITNNSSFALTVSLREGCYSGKSHKFEVAPNDLHDYKYTYTCNGHDDTSDSLDISYVDYVPATYDYFELDLQPYTRSPLTEGSSIEYFEDDFPTSYTLTASDLNYQNAVGNRYHTTGNVALNRQVLRIRAADDSVQAIFIGIHSDDFSPVLPTLPGSFEKDLVIFQPMTRNTYKTSGRYYSNGGSAVCDDFECKGGKS